MLVQLESLLLASVTTRILYFHTSTDYILIFLSERPSPLPLSIAYSVLPSRGIVVEPFLSDLDADCPLLSVLRTISHGIAFISPYTIQLIFSAFATIHAHIILTDITL